MSSVTPQQPPTAKKSSNKKPKNTASVSISSNINTNIKTSSHHYPKQHQRSEPPFQLYTSLSSHPDVGSSDNVVTCTTSASAATTTETGTSASTSSVTPTFQQGWNSVVQLLRGRKRIAILTGAGISVSCGIPDFRTKGSGLYSTLDTAVCDFFVLLTDLLNAMSFHCLNQQHWVDCNMYFQALGLSYPEDLFDAHFFRENPAPFYKFARKVRSCLSLCW
jgi:Sir2 family